MTWSCDPAEGLGVLETGTSWRVSFDSTTITGEPLTQTGLIHLPCGDPPPEGWPVLVYGHMTTGAGPQAAPSLAGLDHPDRARMSVGDDLCAGAVAAGVAVLRPDYEGIGSGGRHPYLIGDSLATSVLDMLTQARAHLPLSQRWVSSGHSEGAHAALHAGALAASRSMPPEAVVLFTPVTRMDFTIGLTSRLPAPMPGQGVVTSLIALMVEGTRMWDARWDKLALDGGLSEWALERWPLLHELCLEELAPHLSRPARALWGPRGEELRAATLQTLAHFDPLHTTLPLDIPIRIDAGIFDEVAPFWLTNSLARAYKSQGRPVTYTRWPTIHRGVPTNGHAARPALEWIGDVLHK